MNIEIANRLVKMRKEKGYSQEDLADALGISRQAVSKWERAEASPDTDNLICLAKLYNVSLDELLSSDEPIEDIVKEQKEKTNEEKSNKESLNINGGTIHLVDEDGSEVFISNKGVKAFDENGNAVHHKRKNTLSSVLEGTLFLLATVAFILVGTLKDFWYGAWVVFFLPEIICSLVRCIENKDLNQFNMPFLCCFVFFFVCMVHPGTSAGYGGLWHPMWVVFLGVPIYYTIVSPFCHKNEDCDCKNCDCEK